MKASKLREMAKEDLLQEESDLRAQIFKLRFQAATGQAESAARIRGARRDVARIETVLRELEIAQQAKK